MDLKKFARQRLDAERWSRLEEEAGDPEVLGIAAGVAAGVLVAYLYGDDANVFDLGKRYPDRYARAVLASFDFLDGFVEDLASDPDFVEACQTEHGLIARNAYLLAEIIVISFRGDASDEAGWSEIDAMISAHDHERELLDATADSIAAAAELLQTFADDVAHATASR